MGEAYHIKDNEGTYFLTFQVINWIDIFTRQRYRDIIAASFNPIWLSDAKGDSSVPIGQRIKDLWKQWNVQDEKAGGTDGYNKVLAAVNKTLGSKKKTVDSDSKDVYNLIAQETVRQQIFYAENNKVGDFQIALTTIRNAYKESFGFVSGKYKLKADGDWGSAGSHITHPPINSDDFDISISWTTEFFTDFAHNNTAAGANSFGFLTRSIFHEYIHARDIAGIGFDARKVTDIYEAEIRAHNLMFAVNSLPPATLKEEYFYKTDILHYIQNGRPHGDLYQSVLNNPNRPIPEATRSVYLRWHQEALNLQKPK